LKPPPYPPPDPGLAVPGVGGFGKGLDQIIPKPPTPGEDLEIKFSSPWEQIGEG